MYVCMMYVCTYVRMYDVCMYICMMYVCTYVCMYICMYDVCTYSCMYVRMYICMYAGGKGMMYNA